MVDAYLFSGFIIFLIFFIIYLLIDFTLMGNPNAFMNKWLTKSLWLWLPFYALPRLIKEVILKKKK